MTTMMLRRLMCLALLVHDAHVLSAAAKMPATRGVTSQLTAVSKTQVAALDGAEWESLQSVLMEQNMTTKKGFSEVGYMTVVTGTVAQDTRVVGIQAPPEQSQEVVVELDPTTHIYDSSMATIPKNVSDQDAITTLVASLVGVHCALPKIDQVGGATNPSFVSGKVLVVGGSDYASFAAEGLSALGASVVQVSTGSPKLKKGSKVEVMPPAVGELELGFAAVVGEFDSLLDTMSDEAKRSGRTRIDDDNDPFGGIASTRVVSELKKQHKCNRYVSTFCHSQRIIRDEGVLWGPKKADAHFNEMSKKIASGSPSKDMQPIVPPKDFAYTLQTLLDQGVTWKAPVKNKVVARGWSLSDFWELMSWPRDSASGGDVRYGLPVVEDLESAIQERMISEPPPLPRRTAAEEKEQERQEAAEAEANPYVLTVRGVDGLQRDIIAAEKDCLLFLSAPYCRTCRYLNPLYTRMARQHSDSSKVTFAKADASGKIGKALGKALEVDAVPTFILFRQGQVYGSPLSVSRLPSKKLDRAVEDLAAGVEWDSALLDEEA